MTRISLLFSLTGLLLAQPAQKKRVAVFDFDYATVHTYVASIFGSNVDVGKGIADMLVDRLVTDGVYSVIERKALDKILGEQNFNNSDRADPNTAARLGRILGVDAIIIGSITQFGRDDKTTSVGALGRVGARYGLGGVGKRDSKAVVGISARMVNVETGEILAVATGKGESARSGALLTGAGGAPAAAGGAGYEMSSKNFGATILGEATGKAVTEVAQTLEQNAARLPARVVKIDGLVADVSGNTLVLNVGSKNGIKVGDKLEIRRAGRTITDPATGKVLRRITEKLGEAVVTEVDESSSVANFSGSQPAKVGDTIGTP